MKHPLLPVLVLLGLIPMSLTAQVAPVVASNTAFGLKLYQRLAASTDNLFFSPHSISTCLAMIYAGAAGDTQQQMARVLGFEVDQTQFASDYGQLQRVLQNSAEPNVVELNIANALWTQQGFPFLPGFLATASTQYQANINQADFVSSAAAVTRTINDWVAQQTRDKIQDILPAGSITPLTRLVLANAMYFKGTWSISFAESNTVNQPFHLSSTAQTAVPMMHQPYSDSLKFRYGATAEYQALELPYGSNHVSMVLLLPMQTNGYAQLEQQLSPAYLQTVLGQMQEQGVEVFLPKFTLASSFDLTDTLSSMGMSDPFSPALANFAGIDGARDLFVSFLYHKAWAQVDEQGTEAAAATVGGISTTVVQEHAVFRADRPFLFFIRDVPSGTILFLGRVLNPSQAVPAPQLQVALAGGGSVGLSWPTFSTGFVLQESPSLILPSWTAVTNSPSLSGARQSVLLPRSSTTRFYRLRQSGQ